MVQQPHVAEKFKKSYPFVGLVFGTHVQHQLPELLYQALTGGKRVTETTEADGVIAEGSSVRRDGAFKAFVPIMYGCDNFCSYCVVPYVRGRERSREPEHILAEVRELAEAGYKDITLLGQNVNSYNPAGGMNFPGLLRQINDIPGDFIIRCMTSHPKDATRELFDTIAGCDKIARHFHLPFQSGSSRILQAMNRGYTREQYISLIEYARKAVPGIVFTSDVIVGFPGETREDFEETLSLIRKISFVSLYTFLFSPRKGTPAAEMDDPVPQEEKSAWFSEMLELQESLSAARLAGLVGETRRVLVESEEDGFLQTRMAENIVVRVQGDPALVGQWAQVKITGAGNWVLSGEVVR
jgi:tRNA-2-methylthio-N6-dimethylallyladenosine synthase